MAYTVKQLSDLAGVSIRTLHYYDQIDLLTPDRGDNGYRYYADEAVLKLQQILFYRELGLSLEDIRGILDAPDFDLLAALHAHRAALQARVARLTDLIETVDTTILHMTGEVPMSQQQMFNGFSEEDEQRYAQEARERWDADEVDASYKRWNRYSAEEKGRIKAEGAAIYTDLAAVMDQGAASPAVQAIVARWHQHLRYFYEPSIERLEGLGQLYVVDPAFARSIGQVRPDLPAFMREAITLYCAHLREGG
jgi:DNA-binding transcriptional MerR regulator